MKYLQNVPIHKDDLFFIPAGTIHAIGAGALVAEIQESSNLTYRLYDYDRIGKDGKKRELHIDKALDVADLHGSAEPRQPLRVLKYRPGMASELLIRCKYFEVYRMLINGVCQEVQRWPVVGNWFGLWPCGYCWTFGSDPIKNDVHKNKIWSGPHEANPTYRFTQKGFMLSLSHQEFW